MDATASMAGYALSDGFAGDHRKSARRAAILRSVPPRPGSDPAPCVPLYLAKRGWAALGSSARALGSSPWTTPVFVETISSAGFVRRPAADGRGTATTESAGFHGPGSHRSDRGHPGYEGALWTSTLRARACLAGRVSSFVGVCSGMCSPRLKRPAQFGSFSRARAASPVGVSFRALCWPRMPNAARLPGRSGPRRKRLTRRGSGC